MKIVKFFIVLSAAFLMIGCSCNQNSNKAKKEKEVKKSEINVEIVRFENELFACNPDKLDIDLPKLENKYPAFYKSFYNQILQVPSFGDKGIQLNYMQEFITNKYNVGLRDTVLKVFPNLDFLKDDLQVLFANYKSYYPEKPTPTVFTCISEFQIATFTVSDSILGISLDMYLSKNYIYYEDIFKQYSFMIPTFDKKYLAIDCANVLATNLVNVPGDKSTLLDKMIAKGKIFYAMESFFPDKDLKDIIKYDEKGWKFCIDNEPQIWSYFLNQNLLYDTKFEQFKYVTEGPTTYGMPSTSPGRVGAWLGWQIVRAYMKENPKTTLKELIAIKDGQKILTDSKYKPKASK